MSAKITSIGLKGLEGYRVIVEVQAMEGIPSIKIVGLPDASVKEAKERIIAAFHSLGFFLHKKIIINLSPPEQKKNGPLFDLPMAIGILHSINGMTAEIPEQTGFLGALSLDGSLQAVEGMLPAVLAAKKSGLKKLYLPFDENFPTIAFDNFDLIYASTLQEVLQDISGQAIPQALLKKTSETSIKYEGTTFQQIVGHAYAKRALEVAAAGGHHLFMTGPPGCGKSMLAESFPSILPPLLKDEWIEVMSIYQLSGTEPPPAMLAPYRNPHHSASGISIIGGGQSPKPGEISLAHRGVLFLDEIAEFNKKTLDMLRQPFESGKVTISRVRSTVTYPASFILLGAMNPCPCGYRHSPNHYCTCTPKQIVAYQNRLSGPIRDRFDLFLTVKPVEFTSTDGDKNSTSEEVRQRVMKARERQYYRYGQAICNSRVAYDTMLKTGQLTDRQNRSLQQFISKNQWSNRSHLKLIRLARTLADLENQSRISDENILEAIRLHGRKSLNTT